MSFDPTSTMLELMSDKQLLTVFKRVAERRSANLTELSGSDSIDDTANQMQTLLRKNLVAEKPAPLKAFSTYYITSDGLEMERKLKRLGS
jgi:hypothetical protein